MNDFVDSNGLSEFQEGNEYLQKEQYVPAKEMFLTSAEKGYAQAQFSIGSFYIDGIHTFEKDMNEGIKWIKKSADQNNADACESLGNIYSDIQYPIYNLGEAVTYLERAFELGKTEVAGKLGLLYLNDNYIGNDLDKAKKYIQIAYDKDLPAAYYGLGIINEKQNDDDNALMFYNMAKSKGYTGQDIEDAIARVYATGVVMDHCKGGSNVFIRAIIISIIFYIIYYLTVKR